MKLLQKHPEPNKKAKSPDSVTGYFLLDDAFFAFTYNLKFERKTKFLVHIHRVCGSGAVTVTSSAKQRPVTTFIFVRGSKKKIDRQHQALPIDSFLGAP
jgi:hypothetical protein